VQPSLEVIEKPKEMVDFHALDRSTVQTENQQNEGIFTCSNDGCMSSFNTHQELHDPNETRGSPGDIFCSIDPTYNSSPIDLFLDLVLLIIFAIRTFILSIIV
jgi:hypothetical protein